MTDIETNSTGSRPSSFTVLGRTIPVLPLVTLSEGQRLGLLKILHRYTFMTLDASGTIKLDQALAKLLDPADNDWLDFQIMEDKLEWPDVLAKILGCLRGSDEEPQPPAKKVAKKAAKRAPAKKVVLRRA